MKLEEAKQKMEKAIDFFCGQLIGIHHGVISAGLVDTVKVNHYGSQTPIKFIAESSGSPNGISIEPHDPNDCGKIVTALKAAGFNAYTFSKTMAMVSTPPPSLEDRKQVRDRVKKLGEEAKVAIRNVRKNFKKQLSPEAPKSEKKGLEKKLQGLTDEACKQIEAIAKDKISKL